VSVSSALKAPANVGRGGVVGTDTIGRRIEKARLIVVDCRFVTRSRLAKYGS